MLTKRYILTFILAFVAVFGYGQVSVNVNVNDGTESSVNVNDGTESSVNAQVSTPAEVYITKKYRVEVTENWMFVNGNTYYVEYVEEQSPDVHVYFVRDHMRTNRYYYYIFDTRTSPYIVHYSTRFPHVHHRAPIHSHTRIPYCTRPIPHHHPNMPSRGPIQHRAPAHRHGGHR